MALNYQGFVNLIKEWLEKDKPLPYQEPSSSMLSAPFAWDLASQAELVDITLTNIRFELGDMVYLSLEPGPDWELTDDFENYPNGFKMI